MVDVQLSTPSFAVMLRARKLCVLCNLFTCMLDAWHKSDAFNALPSGVICQPELSRKINL